MTFQSMKKYLLSFILVFAASSAFAESFVEFVILEKVWPDHKWGHVSLRVKDNKQDLIFDFGRYGKMWGFFNTEGEPVLRVWKNANAKHMAYQKAGNPVIHTIRFPSTSAQALSVIAYYKGMIGDRKPYLTDSTTQYYNLGSPNFHSINHNCTTLSIRAFEVGFPEYNVNNPGFAKGDGLYWWARSQAVTLDFDQDYQRWSHIWWPKDLLNSLQRQFVAKGLAEETIH